MSKETVGRPIRQTVAIKAVFVGMCIVSLWSTIPLAYDKSPLDPLEHPHAHPRDDAWLDRPLQMILGQEAESDGAREGNTGGGSNANLTTVSRPESRHTEQRHTETVAPTTTTTTTTDAMNMTANENANATITLSLLFPSGLLGGYRNQAMRFLGLLRYALDNGMESVLLPTLVWGTRYLNGGDERTRVNDETYTYNPAVNFWPIPFDELFDVDHWNSFHTKRDTDPFSLPKLVNSIHIPVDENENQNHNPISVCWKEQTDDSIVSVDAIQKANPNFTKSFVPLLTRRMLFGADGEDDDGNNAAAKLPNATRIPSRKPFVLDPVQAEVVEFLTGKEMAQTVHKVDLSGSTQKCTHPTVHGGKSRLIWNSYLHMDKMIQKSKRNPNVPGLRQQVKSYKKLVETFDEALVPAKPWRILADQCVEHHLGLGMDEFQQEEEDPHAVGHDHGYIALHSRVEPQMLRHNCGKQMERNLTNIFTLVDLLALDYNSPDGLAESLRPHAEQHSYQSPISPSLRKTIGNHKQGQRRLLKGTFVAVARDELKILDYLNPKLTNMTIHNLKVLNQRSISYDHGGNQVYSKTLQQRDQQRHQQQSTKENRRRRLAQGEQNSIQTDDDPTTTATTTPLPIFECGDGWVKHAFYESEARQKKLFTPSSSSSAFPPKDYGLYYKYGPQPLRHETPNKHKPDATNGNHTTDPSVYPLLPLPENYFGDLLPSMLNFWLAVRADVFVGVQKSTWSTDVWTTRYYMGKGDRNFEYTRDRGILAIGNGGLPNPHKTC